jgi:hypothetical protein
MANWVLSALKGREFTLSVEAGRLRIEPASRLTEEDRRNIRQHRDELVMLVSSQRSTGNGQAKATVTKEELIKRIAAIEQQLRSHPLWHRTVNPGWFTLWQEYVVHLHNTGQDDHVLRELDSALYLFQQEEQ